MQVGVLLLALQCAFGWVARGPGLPHRPVRVRCMAEPINANVSAAQNVASMGTGTSLEAQMAKLEARAQRLSDAAKVEADKLETAKLEVAKLEEAKLEAAKVQADMEAAAEAAATAAAEERDAEQRKQAEAEAEAEAKAKADAEAKAEAKVEADAEAERESSAALYAALDSLETNMFAGVDRSSVESTPADAQNGTWWSSDDSSSQSANSNLKSQSLREVEGLAREARSFVEGVRSQLERLQGNVVEKVKLEASVAIRVADFVVRRAILDTGRALGAASSALQLGAAPPSSPSEDSAEETAAAAAREAKPFSTRLGEIEKTRGETRGRNLLAAGSDVEVDEGAVDARAAEEAREAQAWAEQAQAQREGVEDAAELLKEGWRLATNAASEGAEGVLSDLSARTDGTGAELLEKAAGMVAATRTTSEEVPQMDAVQDRARRVQAALRDAVASAVETTRADFDAYEQLRVAGQLPTLVEEAESIGVPSLADVSALPSRFASIHA